MSRYGDFCGDDRQTDRQTDGQTNRLLYPCACTRGKNGYSIKGPVANSVANG